MSNVLADLLGLDPHHVKQTIQLLESTVDRAAIDTKLIGDVYERSGRAHRLFGLDPIDTTPHELYAVLRSRAQTDNERLAKLLGGQHPNAVSEMNPLVLSFFKNLIAGHTTWALKTSSAKKLLKKNPPKQLQKALHYRSLDSMLKHEPISQLMTVGRYIEGEAWTNEMIEQYRSLTLADFEERAMEIIYLDKVAYCEILKATAKRHHYVVHNKEMGAVMIAPTLEKVIRGYTLRTASLVLHAIQEVLSFASLIKFHHTDKVFGSRVSSALRSDAVGHVHVAGHDMHWRSIHRHFGSAESLLDTPEHMSTSDWHRYNANDTLAGLSQTLAIWNENEWTGKPGTLPVSFNIVDISIDESYDHPFDKRSLKYMRRQLESELMARYLSSPHIRHLVLQRIKSDNRG